jgi:hypothetical protein
LAAVDLLGRSGLPVVAAAIPLIMIPGAGGLLFGSTERNASTRDVAIVTAAFGTVVLLAALDLLGLAGPGAPPRASDPSLVVSHIACGADNTVQVHLALENAAGIDCPGEAAYTMISPCSEGGSAKFVEKHGGTCLYTGDTDCGDGQYTITGATAGQYTLDHPGQRLIMSNCTPEQATQEPAAEPTGTPAATERITEPTATERVTEPTAEPTEEPTAQPTKEPAGTPETTQPATEEPTEESAGTSETIQPAVLPPSGGANSALFLSMAALVGGLASLAAALWRARRNTHKREL